MLDRLTRECFAQFQKMATDLPLFKWLGGALIGAIHYLLPSEDLRLTALLAFVLIIADTLTGMLAAIKVGTRISSQRLSDIIGKVVAYGSLVLVMSILPRTVPGLAGNLSVTFSIGFGFGIIVLTESVSILENISDMGYKLLGFTTLFKKRLSKLAKELINHKLEQIAVGEPEEDPHAPADQG